MKREDVRRIVQDLMAKYGWTLISVDEMVQRVLDADPGPSPVRVKSLVKYHYSLIFYQACRQSADRDRRERAYTELHHYLYRSAYNRRRDRADDITQNALLLIYEQIDRCRKPGAFLQFALWKLRQAITDHDRGPGDDQPLEDGLGPIGIDPLPDPQQVVERKEWREALVRAVASLPERERTVVILKYWDGLRNTEIAERLGLTPGHVGVILLRAKRVLRQNGELGSTQSSP